MNLTGEHVIIKSVAREFEGSKRAPAAHHHDKKAEYHFEELTSSSRMLRIYESVNEIQRTVKVKGLRRG